MSWILGALAITSVIMCISLFPIIRLEMQTGEKPWWRNRALWASGAFFLHGLGGAILFASPWAPGYRVGSEGLALWVMMSVFTLWLASKALIVSVSGGFKVLAVCLVVWTCMWVTW